MTHESDRQLPIACDLGAIDPDRRPAHLARIERLLLELPFAVETPPDGLAFRFDLEHYVTIAEVVAEECLCCPFFASSWTWLLPGPLELEARGDGPRASESEQPVRRQGSEFDRERELLRQRPGELNTVPLDRAGHRRADGRRRA